MGGGKINEIRAEKTFFLKIRANPTNFPPGPASFSPMLKSVSYFRCWPEANLKNCSHSTKGNHGWHGLSLNEEKSQLVSNSEFFGLGKAGKSAMPCTVMDIPR